MNALSPDSFRAAYVRVTNFQHVGAVYRQWWPVSKAQSGSMTMRESSSLTRPAALEARKCSIGGP